MRCSFICHNLLNDSLRKPGCVSLCMHTHHKGRATITTMGNVVVILEAYILTYLCSLVGHDWLQLICVFVDYLKFLLLLLWSSPSNLALIYFPPLTHFHELCFWLKQQDASIQVFKEQRLNGRKPVGRPALLWLDFVYMPEETDLKCAPPL